ncbi:MAG: ABC transporter ATP-binding protein [Candidatus Heimdallarchaeota archaeon]
MGPELEMRGITKKFPGVLANDHIKLEVEKGEILGLLGENGAGKTTLMNILYGLYLPDSGEIILRGRPVEIQTPRDAIALGIGMVHQHFQLIPVLSVVENIILGMEPKKGFRLDLATAAAKIKKFSEEYRLTINPHALIQNLPVGVQQRVEIIKTLYRGASLLVLDEPTSVLTPQEVEELFKTMNNLKKQGNTIIYISHKLNEVLAVTDRITVLRDGKSIGTVNTQETSPEELARMMVGRDVVLRVQKEQLKATEVLLDVRNLYARDDRNHPVVRGVSLRVRRGEILGIAGVQGNGQTEFVEVLTGLRRAESGTVTILGKDVTNFTPRQIFKSRIAHIPEDRLLRGLVTPFSVMENLILGEHYRPPFSNGILLNWDEAARFSEQAIKEFDIRTPSRETLVRYLSGGNQQKLIVARELSRNPELVIANQPTRGLDVGCIEYVHKTLVKMRDLRKGILLVSADLDEIFSLSDRIAVMYEGEIVGIRDPEKTTPEELGLMMAGQQLGTNGG